MAESFGARVDLTAPQRGLYYVRGRSGSPAGAVQAAGGRVVVQLPDSTRLLALLPVDAHPLLQRHPDVALAGQVAIDGPRFAAFARVVGLDEPP